MKDVNNKLTTTSIEEAYIKISQILDNTNIEVNNEIKNFRESLRFSDDNFNKLDKLFDYANKYYDIHNKHSVCQKGCSHCCKIPIEVSLIEVEYINKYTNHIIQNIENINKNDYCPFLNDKENSCSIYKYRPLVCRTLFTFDNSIYCENNTGHVITSLKHNNELSFMYEELLMYTQKDFRKDIRNYFK